MVVCHCMLGERHGRKSEMKVWLLLGLSLDTGESFGTPLGGGGAILGFRHHSLSDPAAWREMPAAAICAISQLCTTTDTIRA